MTEEIKNGVDSGVSEQDGVKGNEQTDGVKDSADGSNVEEVAKLKEELSKAHSQISKFAEEKKKAEELAEKERISNLSDKEKLEELTAKFNAQEEDRLFSEAFSSQGLNASQYRKALDLFKNKDFNGLASFIAEAQKNTAEQASQKSLDEFKSKFETSKAPNLNEEKSDAALEAFKKGIRGQ